MSTRQQTCRPRFRTRACASCRRDTWRSASVERSGARRRPLGRRWRRARAAISGRRRLAASSPPEPRSEASSRSRRTGPMRRAGRRRRVLEGATVRRSGRTPPRRPRGRGGLRGTPRRHTRPCHPQRRADQHGPPRLWRWGRPLVFVVTGGTTDDRTRPTAVMEATRVPRATRATARKRSAPGSAAGRGRPGCGRCRGRFPARGRSPGPCSPLPASRRPAVGRKGGGRPGLVPVFTAVPGRRPAGW